MSKQIWLGGKHGSITGNYAIVDDDNFDVINQFKWHAVKSNKTFYALKFSPNKEKPWLGFNERMHRYITKARKNKVVDHIDHNGLNNQRYNLRVCSHQKNMLNQTLHSNNTSGFRGVTFRKKAKKKQWRAEICFKGKTINLGSFQTVEEASKAYDMKAKELFGSFYRKLPWWKIAPTE